MLVKGVTGLCSSLATYACGIPADTLRNNDFVTPSKRHFEAITSKWRRFDVIPTLSLRNVFSRIGAVVCAPRWDQIRPCLRMLVRIEQRNLVFCEVWCHNTSRETSCEAILILLKMFVTHSWDICNSPLAIGNAANIYIRDCSSEWIGL